MRLLLSLLLLAACSPCPEGTVKEGGMCVPDTAGGTSDEPLSAENFQRRFNIRRCQAADACLLDEGYDPDYWDVVCDEPKEWDDSCPFDLDAAERCLAEDWDCAIYGFTIYTDPSPSCDDVYACD